ncbi:endo-1,3-beta-xylanase [Streptomyces sp. SID10815]|uniref:endo-1,3-beta-xylanase n=1 Tax=Streptomyces sp. SID10815 TaxID=2706027 RepID=UPI0013CB586A|nr:endo-1,3-beta-xylanase [Streptomyces sp. SID10815]NEA50748.1 endo-1,3-beta-xylanase [Streptomyces sp. SID10815]
MRLRTALTASATAVAATLALLTAGTAAGTTASAAALTARNLPADGKILPVMGQDSDTLSDYKTQVLDNTALNAPKPGGVTLYTNLVEGGSPAPLAGMFSPADWGSGSVDFTKTLSQYPGAALAVGLYMSDATAGCGNQPLRAIIGRPDADITPQLTQRYRGDIDRMVNQFKSWDRQVFLRIGYEFDGPWNCYNADFYKQAFQYIKGRIDALGATKVATVWQSAAWPQNSSPDHPEYNYTVTDPNHLNPWYPGDSYVDYVGLSDFYNAGSLATQWGCGSYDVNPVTLQNRVLDFARSHTKPVMIAEASPQGYSTSGLTKSCIMKKNPQTTSAATLLNEWYAGYWSWIEQNSDVIRVASYINTDWDGQTQWQCANGSSAGGTGCANGYWGDARIQANPTVRDAFLNELRKCVFVGGASGTCTGGGGTSGGTTGGSTGGSTGGTTGGSTGGTTGGGTGGTTGGSTGGTTPPPSGDFTQGVATGSGGHDTLWFKPVAGAESFVAVHYTLDGGGQLNYMATYNSSTGRWELPVTVPAGHTLSYWFDYQPTTQTYQNTTAHYTFTG